MPTPPPRRRRAEALTDRPKLPDYQALLAQRDAATNALSQAREALQGARAQTQAADPEKVTSVGEVQPVSRMKALVALVLPVAGAGLLLGSAAGGRAGVAGAQPPGRTAGGGRPGDPGPDRWRRSRDDTVVLPVGDGDRAEQHSRRR